MSVATVVIGELAPRLMLGQSFDCGQQCPNETGSIHKKITNKKNHSKTQQLPVEFRQLCCGSRYLTHSDRIDRPWSFRNRDSSRRLMKQKVIEKESQLVIPCPVLPRSELSGIVGQEQELQEPNCRKHQVKSTPKEYDKSYLQSLSIRVRSTDSFSRRAECSAAYFFVISAVSVRTSIS